MLGCVPRAHPVFSKQTFEGYLTEPRCLANPPSCLQICTVITIRSGLVSKFGIYLCDQEAESIHRLKARYTSGSLANSRSGSNGKRLPPKGGFRCPKSDTDHERKGRPALAGYPCGLNWGGREEKKRPPSTGEGKEKKTGKSSAAVCTAEAWDQSSANGVRTGETSLSRPGAPSAPILPRCLSTSPRSLAVQLTPCCRHSSPRKRAAIEAAC
jgi:hypothetical protein